MKLKDLNEAQFMEALGILQEECAEVIQAISKVRRSGRDFKPFGGEKTNLDYVVEEINDVLSLLKILSMDELNEDHFKAKCKRLERWSNILNSVCVN
jgi:NTP pyrophosphatase (non-canonical NTP hydrolase)